MKKTLSKIFLLVMVLAIAIAAASCADPDGELWSGAKYKEDTTLGNGAKTVTVIVEAGEKSVTLTLKTDKETLGDALMEHGLVSGDMGDFGLYLKYVNGIRADYDIDRSYWGFYKNGEYMMVGVDGANIRDGEQYELVYSK